MSVNTTQHTTLVLGGGGVAGIAWMTGLIHGLHAQGIDLRECGRIIGTSAGSTVAAQISSGTPLATLVANQTEPTLQAAELVPDPVLLDDLMQHLPDAFKITDVRARSREIAAVALAATTVSEAARRAVIAARLPVHTWPAQPLTVVAVDTATGEARLFDRTSGVELIDAVAASCAVPGVWPAVTLGRHRYMDGGIRSSDNADLAHGARRVIVISPLGAGGSMPGSAALPEQLRVLEEEGAAVFVIAPDAGSKTAMGVNPLDPATRALACQAGAQQAAALADTLAAFWRAGDA
ncbi:MAG: patatin-like phospholipase family protein [Janthinobacterium lividum]